jgi:arylsulfatase A-like enzyme
MHRRQFLSQLAVSAALAQAQPKRPNIVLIYTDDQGYGDLGCFGAKDIQSPHIDRLAKEGVRFTQWYSNSPVCSPSRASLLTGKYPQRHGIVDVLTSTAQFDVPGLRQDENTLPKELKKLAYRTAAIGKWHLGSATHSRPTQQGFDEFFGFYSGWTDYYSHRYYTLGKGQSEIAHDLWRNDTEVFEDTAYQTDILSREAQAFVNRQTQRDPFFLYLSFGAPHYPMMAPEKYLSRFPATMDRDRRVHCAMIAAIDDAVGDLMGLLRRRGLDNNTIVYFQSDNGATAEGRADHRGRPYRGGSNEPLRGHKQTLYEGGIRVPAILWGPGQGIPAGRVYREPGVAMDIPPTMLKLAGGGMPGPIDGADLLNVIRKGDANPHEFVFWNYLQHRAVVHKGRWKLKAERVAPTDPLTRIELFDLAADLGETTNRAAVEPKVAAELTAAINHWESQLR